jgi:glycosyltransferase involved in cell wall biosynthesis
MVKIKILITAERFPPNVFGGGEYSAFLLAKNLAQNNEVHVITSKDDGRLTKKESRDAEELNGINIHRIIPPSSSFFPLFLRDHEMFYTKSFRRIKQFLSRHNDFDILHSMSMNMVIGSVLGAKQNQIPIVTTVNDHWATCFFRSHYRIGNVCLRCSSDLLKECMNSQIGSPVTLPYVRYSMWLRRYFLSKSDGLIAISDSVKDILKANGFKSPIVSIPIVVDTEMFQYQKPKYTKNTLYIGRLDPGKGAETAIETFAHANIGTLTVVGTGTGLERCKKLTRELGIQDKVKFVGNISYNEVPEMIYNSDIVIAPFQRVEAFGRVLLEANACGRGVITSNIGGGSKMLIKNGENGYSFDPEDIKGMGECLRTILSDKKHIKKLGITGREIVENEMKKERITEQIESFYHKIIKSNT